MQKIPDKPTCFIIMPITTPESMVDKYRDGKEHFKHVLETLFIPAVNAAGYDPIPPKTKGSELIQAEIIGKLETSDLVLCDISCLNSNVFFEFGIRTSLNKPVCVVKDDLTEKAPFDTGILNHHEYLCSLDSWQLEPERLKLESHIKEAATRSGGKNQMWKFLGMNLTASPAESDGKEDRLDYVSMQLQSLANKLDDNINTTIRLASEKRRHTHNTYFDKVKEMEVLNTIQILLPEGTNVEDLEIQDYKAYVRVSKNLEMNTYNRISDALLNNYKLSLRLSYPVDL